MSRLVDKVIVIAGGTTGIGAATATRLAKEGAKVVVADINGTGAEQTVTMIRSADGVATPFAFDLANERSISSLLEFTHSVYGGLDGLFNVGADLRAETLGRDGAIVNTVSGLVLRGAQVG